MPQLVKTDHPHIVKLEGVCGGEPIIDGLRVAVRHVATLYLEHESIPDIMDVLDLTEAQVFHAVSYFSDHRQEIMTLMALEERAHDRCGSISGINLMST